MLVIPASGSDVLVLLPGFMIAASAYTVPARSVADAGSTVVVPQLYRRGLGALAGRVPVAAEARSAGEFVRRLLAERPYVRVHLGGHSRGGQAAWVAARRLTGEGTPPGEGRAPGGGRAPGESRLASLILLDPVDGQGRRPSGPTSTTEPADPALPTLVVGAGIGGRCAPAGVDHRQFARAAPAARHVIVDGLGHADLLSGRSGPPALRWWPRPGCRPRRDRGAGQRLDLRRRRGGAPPRGPGYSPGPVKGRPPETDQLAFFGARHPAAWASASEQNHRSPADSSITVSS
jgi:pimeloyl-ACP methyl ester carboxylesterase